MMTIHGMTDSGNCYKPRLLMALLGLPFRHVEVSFLDGGTRQPAFTAKNPNAKVPLLELEDGRVLAESNAILCYLADGTSYMPLDRYERAVALQWMFFEQYSHEPHVAVRRSLMRYERLADQATPARMQTLLEQGNKALSVMETRLAGTPFLAGTAPSVADIALFAYTHCAEEGGFVLEDFRAVSAWLDRVRSLPGFRPMLPD
ncbi:glutathione S-transferase family protein [Chelativorans sp. ZYF759]|uniref:glutathione S-transferase family protein n=1 Tax=Chelativorans sp. ZYF759 TaxID=2692213 RepID=UPI00145C6DF5|nr:glutathione S-transferase family protein [Chelativorans sp. ZYF759]NMG40585.1 glutathione S-transferase family protein [Chelativorans sp. ZYF759]